MTDEELRQSWKVRRIAVRQRRADQLVARQIDGPARIVRDRVKRRSAAVAAALDDVRAAEDTAPPPNPAPKPNRYLLDGPHTRRAAAVALRILGHTIKDIAAQLDCCPKTISTYLAEAKDTVGGSHLIHLIDNIAAPIAVDNLIDGLRAGDDVYTLATLRGRGLLVNHQKTSGAVHNDTSFTVRVELPDGSPVPRLADLPGQIVGIPREVIDHALPEQGAAPLHVREASEDRGTLAGTHGEGREAAGT